MQEFHYRVQGRVRGVAAGFHPSLLTGAGLEHDRHVPLTAHCDPRRIDLRATAHDPYRQVQVRLFRQASAVDVHMLLDVSGSMSFGCKRPLVAEFGQSLAYSVYRTGDRFSLLGFDEFPRADLSLPAARTRAAATRVGQLVLEARPGVGAAGVAVAARRLSERRGLVFLVSDFHFDLGLLEAALSALSLHTIVPVVVWDRGEFDLPEGSGLRRFRDLENGSVRNLWLRPALRRRVRAGYAARRAALARIFRRRGAPPLYLNDPFDADVVSRYFLERLP